MSGLHLNLGSGPWPASSWCNVDARQLPGVDVVADITKLPFPDDSAELVYAGHVFEHLTYLDQLPRALAEVRRVLEPGGKLMVVGPDLDRAIASFPSEVASIWPRDPDGLDPEQHSWPCTAGMMRDALRHAGYNAREVPIEEVGEPWLLVSRIGWQFAMEAACCAG